MWILDIAIFDCISPDVCDPSIVPFLWNFFREHALVFNYSTNFIKRKVVVSIWVAGASENTAKSSRRSEIPSAATYWSLEFENKTTHDSGSLQLSGSTPYFKSPLEKYLKVQEEKLQSLENKVQKLIINLFIIIFYSVCNPLCEANKQINKQINLLIPFDKHTPVGNCGFVACLTFSSKSTLFFW